jgi:hypothetical protein
MKGLLGGSALAVHRGPRDTLRPAGREHGGAGDVEGLLAHLADAAPDDVVHQRGIDARPLLKGSQDVGREVRGVKRG